MLDWATVAALTDIHGLHHERVIWRDDEEVCRLCMSFMPRGLLDAYVPRDEVFTTTTYPY